MPLTFCCVGIFLCFRELKQVSFKKQSFFFFPFTLRFWDNIPCTCGNPVKNFLFCHISFICSLPEQRCMLIISGISAPVNTLVNVANSLLLKPSFYPINYVFEKFCCLKTAIISLSSKVLKKVSIKCSQILCKWEENRKFLLLLFCAQSLGNSYLCT